MRHRRAMVLALGLAVAPTAARAGGEPEPPQPTIRWEAPPQCPSAEVASTRLRERLGPDAATLEVTARVEQDSAGYRAVIEIRAGDVGTVRELSSPSCETLLDVTTLLSAAIAQDATARSSPVADVTEPRVPPADPGAAAAAFVPPPTAASDPPRSGEDDVARARPPARDRARPLQLYAEARFVAGRAVAPDVDLGGGAALGIAWRRAAVELGGTFGAPRRLAIPGRDAEVRIGWWSVHARGCGRVRLGSADRVHLLPCASLHGGGYAGQSTGPALARDGSQRDGWMAAGLGPMLEVGVAPWLGLVVGAEGLVFLRRPALAIEGAGEVVRVRPAGVHATIGLRARFSLTDRGRPGDVGP